ncbi:MAG TPA: dihydroneopterin aldolase [Gracilimonas sp.]|uniref:dihydroneopterin aldolase n=1 Tax=Gracilimonas sp. TaxID=1974203 RepID=UPI002DA05B92|nr:dihydroneopterin aldolase [Gracilimonas sp.]
MDILTVSGMKFFGYHGVQKFEKEEGNNFIVDVEFQADLTEVGTSDDLKKAINYTEVQQITAGVMKGESVDLIETLCFKIGEAMFENFSHCKKIGVCVKKLNPPIDAPIDHTEVRMSWPRS